MAIDAEQIHALLQGVKTDDDGALALAYDLFVGDKVQPLSIDDEDAPEGSFAYHLRDVDAVGDCALLDGNLARQNGVVLGAAHKDLRCSYCSCKFKLCPVALAACFAMHRSLLPDQDIPVFKQLDLKRRKKAILSRHYIEKWSERTVSSERALKLLASEGENDFAGAVIADDDSYRTGFVAETAKLLMDMGKIDKGDGAVRSIRALTLIDRINKDNFTFRATGDDYLKPRTLYVIDRLRDFIEFNNHKVFKNYVIDSLSRIIDDRYVLLVGTRSEIMQFIGLSPVFHFTYEQNRIELGYLTPEHVYDHYVESLDPALQSLAKANEGFKNEFCAFVSFNADALPFKGRELADYLAKNANVLGRLELPESRYQSSSLDEMLDTVVGLTSVKETMHDLERFAIFRKTAEGRGAKLPPANFHMLFTGNPGTGKTMVARMVATMLYKIGITRQNIFKEVSAKDLIGEYVGHTAPKTAAAVGEAMGGVLFIDEAYAISQGGKGELSGADYGAECIAELIKLMEDHKDELVVIFAGYDKEMADFVDANPGIASRIGYHFHFDDYSTDELIQIFQKNVVRSGFSYDAENVDPVLKTTFDYHRRFRSFGNGRFVGTLMQKALVKHSNRMSLPGADLDESTYLTLEDIPSRQELFDIQDWQPRPASELLEPLVGMDDLKTKICEFERVVRFHEAAAKTGMKMPPMNMHMVFTGNPGTGKTTVARIIGQILYNVGAMPTNRFVEVEAKDLISPFRGAGAGIVEKTLDSAMGGVLFIDEAYALLETGDGAEVIAQLVKAMEDHKGEFAVMFAGYRDEMRAFIDLNPGLASRVGYTFHFEDYKTEELEQIFELKMASYGFELTDDAKALTKKVFQYFHNVENFGNGRFVDKVVQEVVSKRAQNDRDDGFVQITAEDIPEIKDLCKTVSMPVLSPDEDFSDDSLRRVAIHEMGHATCRLGLVGETNIVVVTVEREASGSLGYVQHKPGGESMPAAGYFENRIAELMGGMAAEYLYYGDYSAGNSSDLQMATDLARDYVARYGMSQAGFVQYVDERRRSKGMSLEDLPVEVREEMNRVMASAFEKAQDVIKANKEVFDQLVEVLLAEQTISGERIMSMWQELSEKAGAE